jgi:predicted bacteriocin transport accessory protein
MKKKLLVIALAIVALFTLSGCAKDEPRESALSFKKEYEAVNDKVLKGDIKYRTLSIDEKNPYVKVEPKEIVEKIKNKETFYLYVGDPLCPWCRSGLEKMIEVAIKNNIKDIYYIDFWDDNHNEILRDLYEVKETTKTVKKKKKTETKIVKTKDATPEYEEILKAVSEFAQDYTIDKDGKTYKVGVKRIFGGDHFYFENGVCKKYATLRSEKLAKAIDPLTKEVLKDQEEVFTKFLDNDKACTKDGNC